LAMNHHSVPPALWMRIGCAKPCAG
jgi:hypothetical protein